MSNHRSRRRARGGPSTSAVPLTPHEGPPDDAAGHRQSRLEHVLLYELQSLIRDEASDPAVEHVRLLSLHLSVDGGHARVAYAVEAEFHRADEARNQSTTGLERASRFLRARLAAQLDLKRLPTLSFTFVGVTPVPPGGEPWPE